MSPKSSKTEATFLLAYCSHCETFNSLDNRSNGFRQLDGKLEKKKKKVISW